MSKKSTRLLASVLALVFIVAAIATGCSGTGNSKSPSASTGANSPVTSASSPTTSQSVSASTATTVNKRTDLNFCILADPKTLDMTEVSDLVAFTFGYQIYDQLIEKNVYDELVPSLAESWEFVDDGKALVFNLRKGVKFHNGDEMTAEDVLYTFETAKASSFCSSITQMMESFEIIDPYTFKLNMSAPYGAMEWLISSCQLGIMNKRSREDQGAAAFGRNPVGTGAYMFDRWDAGDKVLFKAFADHWRGEPTIKTITFKVVVDQSTGVIALEKGEVDVIDTPPRTDRQVLLANPNLAYYETEIAATVFIAFNQDDPRFSNKALRQAIQYAVDKEEMVLGAVEGLGTPISSPFAPCVFGWTPELKTSEFNLEKAKAKMVEAGYPDGFEMTLYTTESNTYKKPTEVLQAQLREIGIKAEIVVMERNAFWEKMQTNRDYDMFVCAATIGSLNDADYIYSTYHSYFVDNGRNYLNLRDQKVDELLEKGRFSTDPKDRLAAYEELNDYNLEECYTITLYTYLTPIAANKDLGGIVPQAQNKMLIRDFFWK